jgi:hypothetical protein
VAVGIALLSSRSAQGSARSAPGCVDTAESDFGKSRSQSNWTNEIGGNMVPSGFDESNDVLGAPAGMTADECASPSVWRGVVDVAAGTSSGYNYSSGRLDQQIYFRRISVRMTFPPKTFRLALTP